MAKEEIHNWMRTAILLLGIVFCGGGYAMKINDNSVRVKEVEGKVHSLEINQERSIALGESMLATLMRLETKVDSGALEHVTINTAITEIKTTQAVANEKLLSLTKD